MKTKDLIAELTTRSEKPNFRPDRAAGLARLATFSGRAGDIYDRCRNYDLGADKRTNVSALSPWIRHRLITEVEVLEVILGQHGFQAAEQFVHEIFWRTYFKGWLEQHPGVWTAYQADLRGQMISVSKDRRLAANYMKAMDGETGIDCFDAWAGELVRMGYLHNHARMWFASIWIFTLRLPWSLGADFFLRHLLDGDAASNTLGWRWVAGLHTKGKIYLARQDNIRKYTDNRFDPSGLSADYSPINERTTHQTEPIAPPGEIPGGEFILLITDEDCLVSELLPSKPSSVVGFLATKYRSPLEVAEVVKQFSRGAMADALHLASGKIAGTAGSRKEIFELLLSAAKKDKVNQIVMVEPNCGPVKAGLADLENALAREGLRMHFIRRGYDDLVWPHTDKGFFKLKKKIPELVSRI